MAEIFTKVVRLTGNQPNKHLLQALQRGSQILEEQRGNFASISPSMRVVCAYEEYESSGLGMVGNLIDSALEVVSIERLHR